VCVCARARPCVHVCVRVRMRVQARSSCAPMRYSTMCVAQSNECQPARAAVFAGRGGTPTNIPASAPAWSGGRGAGRAAASPLSWKQRASCTPCTEHIPWRPRPRRGPHSERRVGPAPRPPPAARPACCWGSSLCFFFGWGWVAVRAQSPKRHGQSPWISGRIIRASQHKTCPGWVRVFSPGPWNCSACNCSSDLLNDSPQRRPMPDCSQPPLPLSSKQALPVGPDRQSWERLDCWLPQGPNWTRLQCRSFVR